MECRCDDCKYAKYDYEEYYGGGKQYFICGCKKDGDVENSDECPEYVMVEVNYD